MKRLIAIALACLMVCVAFTSCGNRNQKDLTQVKNISELKGAIIAAQTGTFHLEALAQIEGVQKKDYADFTDLLNALRSGAIDGYVAEEPTAYDICGKDTSLTYLQLKNNSTGFTATDSETGIAVAFKTGSEMVSKVNAIIATISAETREAAMKQMVEAAPKDDGKTTALTAAPVLSSTKTDTANGTLKIAMECAYAPFNWTQTDNSNGAVPISGKTNMFANGYDVQVAKYIAAELGMALEVYEYTWDSLIPAVQSGNVDGIIAGMSPTAEREEEVDFTNCYYNSNLVVIIKKDVNAK